MRDYISTILPRIQQYSKQLNDEANFVEIPWAFLDEAGAKVIYIFRRNNELLVSRYGDVATGRWEYLPVVQSLLIEYQGSKRLYNQGFLDKAVMVLRKDGTEELFALGNSQIVADLNIAGYLETEIGRERDDSLERKRPKFVGELEGGQKAVFWAGDGQTVVYLSKGTEVTMSDKSTPLPDGKYKLKNGYSFVTKNGLIHSYNASIDQFVLFIFLLVFIVSLILVFII